MLETIFISHAKPAIKNVFGLCAAILCAASVASAAPDEGGSKDHMELNIMQTIALPDAEVLDRSPRYEGAHLAEPEHRSVFVNGTGWGLYEQRLGAGLESELSLAHGTVGVRVLEIGVPEGKKITDVRWDVDGESADCGFAQDGRRVSLRPKARTVLTAGDLLTVKLDW